LTGLQGAALKDEVNWWLDLYRWEFPLPEREAVAAELGRLLEYFHAEGATLAADGDTVNPRHPLVRSMAGLLDNFCEAYWIAARTLTQLGDGGMPHKTVLELARKRYSTSLLLGEVHRPEGNTNVTLGNALDRFAEVGLITIGTPPKGRERVVHRGPAFPELTRLESRLSDNLQHA